MTLIGLGLDVTEISRITYMLERYGARFKQRIFTDGEIAYCERRKAAASSFAALLATRSTATRVLRTRREQEPCRVERETACRRKRLKRGMLCGGIGEAAKSGKEGAREM